jgi:hypothetical protein
MTDKDHGGPAFPVHPDMPLALGCTPSMSDAGMTLRDWFAGQALAGNYCDWGKYSMNEIAQMSYTLADAMLEARK